jgi:anti-sigma B factor antagonist
MSVGGKSSFELERVSSGGVHTLMLVGDIDLLAASDLEDAIQRLCTEGTSGIVLDLRKVTFMDSTGLRATINAHNLCMELGYGFSVTPGPPQVRRLFEVVGISFPERLCA